MSNKQSSINKEFVHYKEAFILKELGFDEPCLASYETAFGKGIDFELGYIIDGPRNYVLAPTFSQAFRWFREKYELHSYIYSDYSWNISGGIWDLNGYKDLRYDWDSEPYTTFEEAESACLDELIEIVKNKK